MTSFKKTKKSSIEKFPLMLKILKVDTGYSPNMIAKKIKCDKRTVEKMLNVGTQLKMIECNNIKLGKRIYRSCKLRRKIL